MGKHSKGVQKGKFCALRTGSSQKCTHKDGSAGSQYREVCEPSWSDVFFFQGRKKTRKEYEAHHILCVASVTGLLAKKGNILEIIEQTKWCINVKKNMVAMPLWGHTVQYYANIEIKLRDIKMEDRIRTRRKGPPFKKIPQHDYDHNSKKGYKSEVDKEMKRIAKQIADNKDKHKAAVASLKRKLNAASKDFRDELVRRGKRCGGTHKAWLDGMKELNAEWYKPFSMADDGNVDPRAFPMAAGSTAEWFADKIKSLVRSFTRK
jgi:uncharacterized protein YdaT